jgi:hypothetical protein
VPEKSFAKSFVSQFDYAQLNLALNRDHNFAQFCLILDLRQTHFIIFIRLISEFELNFEFHCFQDYQFPLSLTLTLVAPQLYYGRRDFY